MAESLRKKSGSSPDGLQNLYSDLEIQSSSKPRNRLMSDLFGSSSSDQETNSTIGKGNATQSILGGNNSLIVDLTSNMGPLNTRNKIAPILIKPNSNHSRSTNSSQGKGRRNKMGARLGPHITRNQNVSRAGQIDQRSRMLLSLDSPHNNSAEPYFMIDHEQ